MKQLNILYVGTQNRSGFVDALANRHYITKYFATSAEQAYEFLPIADGVVLIGNQDRILGGGYSAFLREIHERKSLLSRFCTHSTACQNETKE